MIKIRNSDLNEERKIIREEISEGKMKTIFPLFFKEITVCSK